MMWCSGNRRVYLFRLPGGHYRIRIYAVIGWRLKVIVDWDITDKYLWRSDWQMLMARTKENRREGG